MSKETGLQSIFEDVYIRDRHGPDGEDCCLLVVGEKRNGSQEKIAEIMCGSGEIVWEDEALSLDRIYDSKINGFIDLAKKSRNIRISNRLREICEDICKEKETLDSLYELLRRHLKDEYNIKMSSEDFTSISGVSDLETYIRKQLDNIQSTEDSHS